MYHQSGRLVKYQKILILVYYVQRDVLRQDFQPASLVRHHKCDDVSRSDYAVRLRCLSVYLYIFLFDGQLDTVPGGVFHMGGEIFVYAHGSLAFVQLEAEMLEHLLLLVLKCRLFQLVLVTEVAIVHPLSGQCCQIPALPARGSWMHPG